jgi:hypothetical protein
MRAYVVAAVVLLPLLVPEVWSGFRLAQSDTVLSVIAPTEQPLSVRNPAGVWAAAVALAWFGLAYWQRRVTLWEAALVLIGGVSILARLGNAWLYAAAMLPPLGHRIALARPRTQIVGAVAALGMAVTLAMVASTRPPELAAGARAAAASASTQHAQGAVLADWRWAADLQRNVVGSRHTVLAAGGLASESPDFWLDYVRILQGHERWAEALQRMNVDLLVVDTHQHQLADLVRTSNQWRVVYDADEALVAERAAP